MIFPDRLRQLASSHGECIAIVANNKELTYRELLRRVTEVAEKFTESGLRETDTAGVCIRPEPEHLISTLALMMMGANQIVLASHDSPDLHETYSERVGVNAIVSDGGNVAWRNPGRLPVGQLEGTTEHQSKQGSTLYFRTSGTTGEPNIIPLSEQQLALQAIRHTDYENERLLRLASIEHNNSKRHRLYCLCAGGTNVFRPNGHLDLAEFVEHHCITCLDISRMHASELLEMPVKDVFLNVKVRTGGSAVPYSVRKPVQEKVTSNLYVRYAATECGAISMALPGDHDEEESSGIPLDGVQVEIVSDVGDPVSNSEIGEIRVRANGMAEGYLDSPEAASRRFRSGWFYPGDLGYIRPDGCLVVKGRKDDMLILNGINIYPVELERVLEAHPAVQIAAVVGLPSKRHGDIPVAAVELCPGAVLAPSELKMFSREQLGLRTPRRIVVVDELPRNAQGKLTKQPLREMFLSGHAKPILAGNVE